MSHKTTLFWWGIYSKSYDTLLFRCNPEEMSENSSDFFYIYKREYYWFEFEKDKIKS